MTSIEVISFSRKLFDSSTRIFAHLSFGNPNIPELIAGIETELKFCSDASNSTFLTAFVNFRSSFPSPILGPTACITALHDNFPAVVITAEPTGTNPILSLSSCIDGPPFLTMAAATPPPCFR